MASAFGHALTSIAIGSGYSKKTINAKFVILGIICSILPDADVISFKLGVHYGDFWGHRGFTHSILFAIILGSLVTFIFYKNDFFNKQGLKYFLFFTFCTASHGILDAMTSGGLGVAFFSPFDTSRYFLPWRPIKVSPIGAGKFFSERGLLILKSEAVWIGIPSAIYILAMLLIKKLKTSNKKL
ncbi:MAG: metal-dependent hydrolase [Bacteroidia bacterium]